MALDGLEALNDAKGVDTLATYTWAGHFQGENMPNWVTTHLEVTGPADQLAAFRDKARSAADPETGARELLSFNSFLPMPPSMNVEASSVADLGYAVYHGGHIGHYLAWPDVLAAGVTDRESLMLYLDVTKPEARSLGAVYASNLAEHGVKNWYDWSVANWGTKWDACDVQELDTADELWRLQLCTAWSPAEPVLEAMSEQFPLLKFVATFDEESHSFFYEATWEAGVKTESRELERDSSDEDDDEGDD